jgi:hypothetical protein
MHTSMKTFSIQYKDVEVQGNTYIENKNWYMLEKTVQTCLDIHSYTSNSYTIYIFLFIFLYSEFWRKNVQLHTVY